MTDFYLYNNETIILTSPDIVMENNRYEAILTTRRLILIRSDDPASPSREIPLRGIGSAIAGENSRGEPTITLSQTSPDGVLQALELVFSRGTNNYQEWVTRLKEQIRQAALEPEPSTAPPVKEDTPDKISTAPPWGAIPVREDAPKTGGEETTPWMEYVNAAETSGEERAIGEESPVLTGSQESPEPAAVSAVPESPPTGAAGSPPVKPEARGLAISPVHVVVIILVIAAVLLGAYAYTKDLAAGTPGAMTQPTTEITTIPTTVPATTTIVPTTIIPTTIITTSPASTMAPASGDTVIVPSTGIYVRVRYDGNFAGQTGFQGSLRDVAGSGDQFFQIPATGKIVDASIRKLDNTGKTLTVTIYSNGTAVKEGSITAPGGTLSLSAWI